MHERKSLVIALLLSVMTCVVLGVKLRQAEHRADITVRWTRFVMDSLGATVRLPSPPPGPEGRDSVYWQWVATSAQMQSRRWQLAVQHWAQARGTLLDEIDTEELRRKGLADPPRQLRDSLTAHPELIPYDPVLGGHMMFDEIDLLQPAFAFAMFDDGHIDGAMLLEYEIDGGGRVRWKRLWSRLN